MDFNGVEGEFPVACVFTCVEEVVIGIGELEGLLRVLLPVLRDRG